MYYGTRIQFSLLSQLCGIHERAARGLKGSNPRPVSFNSVPAPFLLDFPLPTLFFFYLRASISKG